MTFDFLKICVPSFDPELLCKDIGNKVVKIHIDIDTEGAVFSAGTFVACNLYSWVLVCVFNVVPVVIFDECSIFVCYLVNYPLPTFASLTLR